MRTHNHFFAEALWQSALIILIAVVLSLSVNYFRHGGIPISGEKPAAREAIGEGNGAPASPDQAISLEEARALFLTGGAVFIDARPEEVYRSGHIKGAINLPPENIGGEPPEVVLRIPLDSLIVTYCDGENCSLSEEAALQLSARGYSHAQVLLNGWTLWHDADLPTETSPQ